MSKKPPIIIYRGRSFGIVILTVAQLVIGIIHAFFGLMLLAYENLSSITSTAVYDVYTIVFGLFTLIFAVLVWRKRKAGWIGTVAVSIFVTAVDSLALLNLPSIPGIPKFPAITEIGYSLLVVFYLFQGSVRKKFLVPSKEKMLEKTK